MKNSDRIEIVLAGGAAGLFAAGANIAARYTTDPSDVLGFIGGIIGAAGAVVGARWIESSKRADQMLRHKTALAEMLTMIVVRAQLFDDDGPDEVWKNVLALAQMVDTFATLSEDVRTTDPDLYGWLMSQIYWFRKRAIDLYSVAQQIEDGADLPDAYERVGVIVDGLAVAATVTLRSPAGWPDVGQGEIVQTKPASDITK